MNSVTIEQPSNSVEPPRPQSPVDNFATTYSNEQLQWLSSKKICDECQSIFLHWPSRERWKSQRSHHTHNDFAGLNSSAQSGCPICEMFLDDFVNRNPINSKWPKSDVKALVAVNLVSPGGRNFDVELTFDTELIATTAVINVDYARNDHITQVGLVEKYTDSEGTWELARMWLKRCVQSHSHCSKQVLEKWLPSRLVHIESRESQPRLCLSQDLPPNTQYLTLSHCWGKKHFTTLTRESLKAFKDGIPIEAVSKTFREALKATIELGFHYIWIDSLCIIQDDPNDWVTEAAIMGRVYANSTLNLAAIDAPDGDTGCFIERGHHKVYGWKVPARMEDNDPSTSLWDCSASARRYKTWFEHILSTRAWVYQERCLTPRTLGFGWNQTIWECRSMGSCETFHLHCILRMYIAYE